MDLATFQWVAGIAGTIIVGLVGYIARETNEKLRDLRQEIREAWDANEKLRSALEEKNETLHRRIGTTTDELHDRINDQVAALNAQSVTLAGFQGTFMTREEHARHCQQQHQIQHQARP